MKKILVIPFILLLLVSFGYAELITDGINISSCGETQFEVLNQADYNYLIYNDCQEWRFPRILTNIKTTFLDNGLNTKVIPLNISEMNQNNTPDNYSDDYPVKTLAISSINVVPIWDNTKKELSWDFYFDNASANLSLYYTIKDNAGKWGLEIYNWDFANPTNYILLRNQIFSGGEYVDFDCSDFSETRKCSFLDEDNSKFSTLYFDKPTNDGQVYDSSSVWYSQSGQNHNLYQDLGRGEEIILDPTITSELTNTSHGRFINIHGKPQCILTDTNMFCVGRTVAKALRLVTATLPDVDDWTISDWNFLPLPSGQVKQSLMISNDNNFHVSYLWDMALDNNVLLATANSDYMNLGSWNTVSMIENSNLGSNAILDVNADGWVTVIKGRETIVSNNLYYMGYCNNCINQDTINDDTYIKIDDAHIDYHIFSGVAVTDDKYIMFVDTKCTIATWTKSTSQTDSLSISGGVFDCETGTLKTTDDRLYLTYTNETNHIGYIQYIDIDKNIADASLWSTPITISSNYPLSYSMAFIDRVSADDFNSFIIAYSEGGSTLTDHNRFVGYKKFSTLTNSFTNNFTIVDENIEDYSESVSTDAYFDNLRNKAYILYQDENSSNFNTSAYIIVLNMGIAGSLNTDFNYTAGEVTDFNILYSFYNDSTYTDVNNFTFQWDVNGSMFSINEDANRSLTLGLDYNICLEVTGIAFDGNIISDQECEIIRARYGSLTMSFVDENTSVALTTVDVTFNGTTYDVNADGMINISLAGISKGLYTISASDPTHPVRTFTFELNYVSIVDANVILLQTTKGKNIDFKFYGSDETTILSDANISIKNTTANKYAYIKATTNSAGEATFFLNPEDYAYEFEIEDDTGDYTYSSGIITVKRPKNIIDLNIIIPYNITRDGLVGGSVNSLTTDINFNVFTNIVIPYGFLVDANSGLYYITSGSFSLIGDENIIEYQPYLVPVDADEGIEVSIYTIDNQNNRKSLPDVLIELYTAIDGVDTLVASKTSDGTGKAVMHFAKNKPYTLKAYYKGLLKLSITIENPASNIFLYIETGTFEEFEAQELVQVIWYYNTSNLIPVDSIVTMLQTIIPIATTVGDVNITISQSGTLITTTGFTLNTSVDTNVSYDVNIAGLNQYLPLVVNIRIYNTSGVLLLETSGNYSFVDDTTWQNTISNLRTGFGLLATTLIMIILCIYLMSLIATQRIGQDNNWLFILPMIILGLGAFLGLIDMIAWFLASLFGISLAIWRVRA